MKAQYSIPQTQVVSVLSTAIICVSGGAPKMIINNNPFGGSGDAPRRRW